MSRMLESLVEYEENREEQVLCGEERLQWQGPRIRDLLSLPSAPLPEQTIRHPFLYCLLRDKPLAILIHVFIVKGLSNTIIQPVNYVPCSLTLCNSQVNSVYDMSVNYQAFYWDFWVSEERPCICPRWHGTVSPWVLLYKVQTAPLPWGKPSLYFLTIERALTFPQNTKEENPHWIQRSPSSTVIQTNA